jgi:hypothetical protein
VLLHYCHVLEAAGFKSHQDFLPMDYLEAVPNNHHHQNTQNHSTDQENKNNR